MYFPGVRESIPTAEPSDPVEAPDPPPPVTFNGQRVLVVEDDAINRKFLVRLLQRSGLDVLEAGDGVQAVELYGASETPVQLILLDVNMPVMDGKDTLRALFENGIKTAVIILSGYGEDDKIREMMAMGCQEFIQKPVDVQLLIKKIQSILPDPRS
jgi:CheY-like chemotaxis protein